MKVEILNPYGYCSGVELAIKLAIKTKEEHPNENVVVLGMLVHNEDTLKNLKKLGIKTIFKAGSSLEELIDEIDEKSIVILSAHGHSKSIEQKLIKNGHSIVDATCPYVKKSFEDIKKAVNSNTIFYIGVNNHPEANAALSISKNVYLIDYKNPVIPQISTKNPLVITQTTLSESETLSLFDKIKEQYPDAIFSKGICHASTSRQNALMSIKDDVDLIIVVGGANSNNSKTLFNLAKEKYPTKKVILIQNKNDLNKKDLLGLSNILISSGASTPKEIVEEIKQELLN